jgi:hypothetical protein
VIFFQKKIEIVFLFPDLSAANKVAGKLKRLGTTFFYTAIKQNRMNEERKAKTRIELVLENAKLREELAKLKEENLILPLRYYIDEDTEERVFDTDEMESEFHDALVDLGAYNDELRCEGCDKRFGKTESSFQNAEGLAVCVDCFKGEESGEE